MVVSPNGKIQYVGKQKPEIVRECERRNDLVRDMQGKQVLPSFIDGHMHLLLFGTSLQKLDLEHCQSLGEIQDSIRAYAQAHPNKRRILCKNWIGGSTNKARASDLDSIDSRPIFVEAKDLHSTWCNSAALAELDVHAMPDPPGGTIHRDLATGSPSGLLSESIVFTHVWPHLARSANLDERIATLSAGISAYLKAGYTSICDMAMDTHAWDALQVLCARGPLPLRITAYWLITPSANPAEHLAQVDRAIQLRDRFNASTSSDCRIAGIKVICDGVIDSCTASLHKPYSNGTSAAPIWTADMLAPVVARACAANLQCALHAIGDAAVSTAISVLSTYGRPGQRHRIEHLELTSPEDAARLGALGITASVQPVHADPELLREWPGLLGKPRCKRAFAYRDFKEGGATVALGTDAPTAPNGALANVYIASTRRSVREKKKGKGEEDEEVMRNEEQRLELMDALEGATTSAAYACFAEKVTGSLKVGLDADFVVLSMREEAEALLEARVEEVWFRGKKVSQK